MFMSLKNIPTLISAMTYLNSVEHPDLENVGGKIQISKLCMHLLTLKTNTHTGFSLQCVY